MDNSTDINPIVITMDNGTQYTLEFNRKIVERAERSGFSANTDELENAPMSKITDLWYWAFQMHHRGVSKEFTDGILFDHLGGISQEVLARLYELYSLPYTTLIVDDGEEPKNATATIQI